jgi:hypothetical protein
MRTVETATLKLHGPNAEGVVTVELIDHTGHSLALFVDKDQAAQQCADLLERMDYGENPER